MYAFENGLYTTKKLYLQREHDWLVVTGCHEFGIFPWINWLSIIIPIDFNIFQDGVAYITTHQS